MTTTVLWLIACGLPLYLLRLLICFSLAIFSPYFLLTPFIQSINPKLENWAQAVTVPAKIFLHGSSGMLISVATITTLSLSDFHQGILRMPLFIKDFNIILLQIVHQTTALLYEIQRIRAAILVRCPAGFRSTALRVLFSFPKVWMPRIIVHAERIAMAMAVRGYCEFRWESFGDHQIKIFDILTVTLALIVLGIALTIPR